MLFFFFFLLQILVCFEVCSSQGIIVAPSCSSYCLGGVKWTESQLFKFYSRWKWIWFDFKDVKKLEKGNSQFDSYESTAKEPNDCITSCHS